MPSNLSLRKYGIAALLFGIALGVLTPRLDQPRYRFFDEKNYVSAAHQILQNGVNENWSHPPLGKALIALSIAKFGSGSMGFRLMSAIFGAGAAVFLYLIACQLFQSLVMGISVFVMTMLNQLHFIHSRQATLEVFVFFFIALATWLLAIDLFSKREESRRSLFLRAGAGVALGLAAACKWFGFAPAALFFFLTLRKNARAVATAVATFVILPIAVYLLATFVLVGMRHPDYAPPLAGPASGYSVTDVVRMQADMAKAQLGADGTQHAFYSPWYLWPFSLRPMWMSYHIANLDGVANLWGVLYMGNLVIFVVGLIALGVCAWHAYRHRCRISIFLLSLFFYLWLIWPFLPRDSGFLYYFYPSAMVFGLLIAQAHRILRVPRGLALMFFALALGHFSLFYPLMTNERTELPSWKVRAVNGLIGQ